MLYGTRELAKKWGVSSETVRRYLKKQGKSKDCGGTFFINKEELKNVEALLNDTRCKVASDFDQSRWKIKKVSKKPLCLVDASISENKIFMKLSDDDKKLWEAFFYCKNQKKGEEIVAKLMQSKKLVIDGIENENTRRIVLKKIRGSKKVPRRAINSG